MKNSNLSQLTISFRSEIRIPLYLLVCMLAVVEPGVVQAATPEITVPRLCKELVKSPALRPSCPVPRSKKSCAIGAPLVIARFHYDYNYNDVSAATDLVNTPSSEPYSYHEKEWHLDELRSLVRAGIDVAAVDYRVTPEMVSPTADPGSSTEGGGWQFVALNYLVEAHHELVCGAGTPPALALYLNTTSFDTDQDPLTPNGYNLRHSGTKEFLYRAVASFFCRATPSTWALVDDRALVFVGSLRHTGAVEDDVFQFLNDRFQADFGIGLYIVKEREDLGLAALDPKTLKLADELVGEATTIPRLQKKLLASEEFYKIAGEKSDSYRQLVEEKLYGSTEEIEPTIGEAADYSTIERREKFLEGLFKGSKRSEIDAYRVAFWYKQYQERLESFADFVKDLRRSRPSEAEVPTYTRMLRVGVQADVARAEVLASDRFFRDAGRRPEIFIRRLFETVYFRCPTDAEVATWTGYLATHGVEVKGDEVPRSLRRELALRLLADAESKRVDVSLLVARYLYRVPGWPGFGDAVFSETAAQCHEFASVASIGPGFSSDTLTVDRDAGRFYEEGWRKILRMRPSPSLVFIQSWNNFREASEISRSKEFGTQFADTTRTYAAAFKSKTESNFGNCP